MTCRELVDLLVDYIGNELHVDTMKTVEVHLSSCKDCVILTETYRHTIRLARALPKCEKLPDAFEERLRTLLAPHLGGGGEKKE